LNQAVISIWYSLPSGLSSQSLEQNSISLYPNPNSGTFTLSYHLPQSGIPNSELRITDITGRTLYSYSIDNMSIVNYQLSIPLSSGIYFWQMVNDEGIIGNGKVVIVHNE
jgi:hypothetical protein